MKPSRSRFCAFCDSKDPVEFIAGLGLCARHNDLVNAIADQAKAADPSPRRRPRKHVRRRPPATAE